MIIFKQFSFIAIGLLITSSLISCDPHGGYEYWIDNQSDSVIYISFSEFSNDTIKTIELAKYDIELLTQYSTINGLYDSGDDFLYWIDSLGIHLDSLGKKQIAKEYLERDSWEYDQEVTGMMGKAGNNIYTLTITNEDLQK